MAGHQLLIVPSERSLSQAESLSLVQIFLNASLACIAHTRELIPWMSPSLRTRYINHIDPSLLVRGENMYKTFQVANPEADCTGQEIRILVPGGHKCADQIVEMLERGVFEALEHGFLDTLQVFVTDNNGDPPTVIESYRFAFSYNNGLINSIELSPTNHVFVLDHFQKSFKTAIRALLRSLKCLPRLPARRKLGMSLTYNEACPDIYQPPGFMDTDHLEQSSGQLLCGVLGHVVEDIVGSLDTSHHQVDVAVCRNPLKDAETPIDPQDAAMSKQLQAMQKTSSIRSTDLVSTLRDSISRKRRNGSPIPNEKRLKLVGTENLLVKEQVQADNKRLKQREVSGTSIGEMIDTGSKNISVASPVSTTRNDGPCLIISKLAELLVHSYAIQCGLSGDDGIVFDQALLADGIIRRRNRSTRLRCECGSALTSGKMIYCDICDNWQHAKCYGYDGGYPVNPPAERICYTCLFFPADKDFMHTPAYIISIRLAVRALTSQTRSSSVVDEQKLQMILQPVQCTKQLLDAVITQLLSEGILSTHDRQGWKVRSLDESKLQGLRQKYGSPFASIDQFYDWDIDAKDPQRRTYHIARALEKYAQGQDFTAGQGCIEVVSSHKLGAPMRRWGYVQDEPVSGTGSVASDSPPATPVRRRKVSISRLLVNIDRSPSAGSMSFEESSLQALEGMTCSSEISPASSTATADL
ncbi:hypothetical protein A1O1_07630 [Capronia coronata CBS 617.96]|uniref:HORMA domain-containing protein n=1 Tax=Capronia coronata CBS 617.96 TaxID=1182541 RepID=W9XX61_9EURO|nr:uncharacterized protein A1O1_07630 [Capronia coronata CBS 617.96]EXJ81566.1 hypothetical protein A1O1_07630 [Capronia coronata CBS 617.96]